jgi:hypothetical protein
MSKKPPPPTGPLTDDDIVLALQKSGYLLEVEVSNDFREEGLDTELGKRMRIGDEQWKEIDVRAQSLYNVKDESHWAVGRVRTLLQLKRLHEPARFVGILGRQPNVPIAAINRCSIAGLPSLGCGDDENPGLFFGEDGLVSLLGPLLSLPVCVHWALVQRNDKGDPRAKAEFPIHEDLRTLICAGTIDDADFSLERRRSSAKPCMSLTLLALMLDTPDLHVFDPASGQLRKEKMVSIHQVYDGPNGPIRGVIDVVVRSETRRYAQLCIGVRDRLKAFTAANAEALTAAASHAHDEQKKRDVENAFAMADMRRGY